MKVNQSMKLTTHILPALVLGAAVVLTGCKPADQTAADGSKTSSAAKTTIQSKGSDTMVNVAQAWAEAYHEVKADVSIEVSGGGSGVGIAALMKGTIDMANASRDMKDSEKEATLKNTGKEAKEFTVGYDALAVFVHKNNPLEEITFEQIDAIFAEGGNITKWSQLGVKVPGCDSDEIIRVSRQSSSGTYAYFREHVLGNKDFKLGSRDMNGSKEVVDLVTGTPCAIGYSGMGYATPDVKMLKVARKAGETAYPPSVANALNKTYPVARGLYVYTLGDPTGAVKDYVDWILGPAGQKIVADIGYVPLKQ
jgi:phosphate transport system substrate-binding protein